MTALDKIHQLVAPVSLEMESPAVIKSPEKTLQGGRCLHVTGRMTEKYAKPVLVCTLWNLSQV